MNSDPRPPEEGADFPPASRRQRPWRRVASDDGKLGLSISWIDGFRWAALLELSGEIDEANVALLISELHALEIRGCWMTLDLGALSRWEEAAVSRFDAVFRKTRLFQGGLALLGVSPQVYTAMQAIGLSQWLPVFADLRAALASQERRAAPAPRAFPFTTSCPICDRPFTAKRAGKLRCRECRTILAADADGQVFLG